MSRKNFFIAIFLIAGGLLLMLKNVFNLRFSSLPVLFSLAMIVVGIYFLTNSRGFSATGAYANERVILFASESILAAPNVKQYTIIFSTVSIEMPADPPPVLNVTSLFSTVRIALPPDHATRIALSAAFGTAAMPGHRVSGFGEHEQLCGSGPATYLSASAVFGVVNAG